MQLLEVLLWGALLWLLGVSPAHLFPCNRSERTCRADEHLSVQVRNRAKHPLRLSPNFSLHSCFSTIVKATRDGTRFWRPSCCIRIRPALQESVVWTCSSYLLKNSARGDLRMRAWRSQSNPPFHTRPCTSWFPLLHPFLPSYVAHPLSLLPGLFASRFGPKKLKQKFCCESAGQLTSFKC